MTLVADDQLAEIENITSELNFALGRWHYSCPSVILHHGKSCCTIAREWLFATDHSQLNGQDRLMGPRWLRKKYNWGPSQWPMTWCQAVEQESLDCGALAAITNEIFAARSVVCYSVQLIQRYSVDTTSHWSTKWTDHPASTHWIQGALIYHEACAVEIGKDEIGIWDPSAGWWANPKQFGGFGSIIALRLITDRGHLGNRTWGEHQIVGREWQIIQSAPRRPNNSHRHTTGTLIPQTVLSGVSTKTELYGLGES